MTTSHPQPNNSLNRITDLNDDFVGYMIIAIVFIILIIMLSYISYIYKLNNSECNYMNSLYSSIDGNIKSISSSDPDCSNNLYSYYIKTAYNSCSGGSYKNDYVNICNLKAILKQGVRGLDFEIYSINNNPVVATSISSSYYVKETFNFVSFSDVMSTINNYAFSGGSCPNPTDPLLIHLRFKSSNQTMYTNLAAILASYPSIMLGSQYSYENLGNNLGSQPLLSFQNKVIIIVDSNNNSFLQNQDFLEYVNITSNSIFMRLYNYYNVKNNPDIDELTIYNKKNMTIVIPDNTSNPTNPSGYLCRAAGCQMVAMRYQYVDNYLEENALFFDRATYAFRLKPEPLRYVPITIPIPTPQDPSNSYATREVSTDYYSFKF